MAYNKVEQKEKVNWLRPQVFANGVKISVSEKSGIVKLEIPGTGRRSPMLYVDELQLLNAVQLEINRYFEANSDICHTQEENHTSREAAETTLKRKAAVAKAMADAGASNEIIEETLKKMA